MTGIDRKYVVLLFALVMAGPGREAALAQDVRLRDFQLKKNLQSSDVPSFEIEMFNRAADDEGLSRLQIRLTFVYDELQFIRFKKKKFRADYEVTVTLQDSTDNEVASKQWTGFVVAQNFDQTNSTFLSHSTEGFLDVPPGRYRFKVGLKDVETRRVGYLEGEIGLRSFSGELMFSDVVFQDSVLVAAGEADSSQSQLYAYFEIYNAPESDSLEIEFQILDSENDVKQGGTLYTKSQGRVTRQSIKIDARGISDGQHRIRLTARTSSDSLQVEQPIACDCPEPTPFEGDLEAAIEVLQYIAKKDELKQLKAAADEETRLKLFNAFWQKRDPTPGTRDNEYKQEFYRRVSFANQKFQVGKPGWRSDMGRVFIMLGPPDYIDRPNSYGTLYNNSYNRRSVIVWNYVNLRRRAVFRYEIGEYRIANYGEIFDLLNGEMQF